MSTATIDREDEHAATRPGLVRRLFVQRDRRLRRGWRLGAYLVIVLVSMGSMDVVAGDSLLAKVTGHAAAAVIVIAVTYLFCRFVDRRPWHMIGLSGWRPREILVGFAVGSVSLLAVFAAAMAAGWAQVTGTEIAERGAVAVLGLVTAGLFMLAMSAVVQEVAFRGYALQTLADGWPLRRAAVVSSVLFAALHLPGVPSVQFAVVLVIEVTLMAGYFILTRMSTGALWVAIGFHTAWNWWMDSVLSMDTDAGPNFGDALVHVRIDSPGLGLGHGGGIEVLYLLNSAALLVGYWLFTRHRSRDGR